MSQKGRGKSRNQVLNRQKSSVSHNQDKQSSASHIKLCATQSGQVKLCVSKQPGKKPEPGFEQEGKLCATQSIQVKLCVTYEALCSTIGTRGSSVLHNNGWRKSRNLALSKQQSSVPHNRDKQSSASHIKLCATQSGQVKLCVTKGPGKRRRIF